MEVDEVPNSYHQNPVEVKCQTCGQSFEDWDKLREHKRTNHVTNTTAHRSQPQMQQQKSTIESEQSDFRLPTFDLFPPDQTQEIMKTLQVGLQKMVMDMMEKFFQQKHQ